MSDTSLRHFEAVKTFSCYGSTFVYNICDLIDFLELEDEEYFQSGKIISTWCKENNIAIYSAPRETFDLRTAVELAKSEGKVGVLVEDLS